MPDPQIGGVRFGSVEDGVFLRWPTFQLSSRSFSMRRPLRCLGPIFLALFVALTVQSLVPAPANAQQQEEDVVYLKDGSVLRGTIVEDVPGESLRIQTRDGNVFRIAYDRIERRTREPAAVVAPTPGETTSQPRSRESLRNDFGIELLGKAALYSFSYQYMVAPQIGVQLGISALGGSVTDATVVFVPLGAKLYLVPKNGSPFITGGVVALTGSADSGPIESATYGYAGLGFEYRSLGGFLFRGMAYGLFAGGEFVIWPGLHVGYAF
jgi:hypothetical protein